MIHVYTNNDNLGQLNIIYSFLDKSNIQDSHLLRASHDYYIPPPPPHPISMKFQFKYIV